MYDPRLGTCEGKEQFNSPALAAKVSARRRRQQKGGHAYKCPFCKKWHIGRPSPA